MIAAACYLLLGVVCALAWIDRDDRAYYAGAVMPPTEANRSTARFVGWLVVAGLVVALWPVYGWLRFRFGNRNRKPPGNRTAAAR